MNIHIFRKPLKPWPLLIFLFALSLALIIDFPVADIPNLSLVRDAGAVIGRPASPNSVSGVRRRTRRRTRRRIAVGTRVYTRPAGCTAVVVRGANCYLCGGVYYQPYYEGSKVVYVVVEDP